MRYSGFKRHFPLAAVLACIIGLILTGSLFCVVRQLEAERAELNFRRMANTDLHALDIGFASIQSRLGTINRLFNSVDQVSARQFSEFSNNLIASTDCLQAAGYVRIVTAGDLNSFEKNERQSYPEFNVHTLNADGKSVDESAKPEYQIVQYVEPVNTGLRLLGVDLSELPEARQAAQKARESGLPQATGIVKFASGKEPTPGFLVYMPVYKKGGSLNTDQARRAALSGFTIVAIASNNFIAQMLAVPDTHDTVQPFPADTLRLSVYQSDRAEPGKLIYASHPDSQKSHSAASEPWPFDIFYDQPQPVSREYIVGQKSWYAIIEKDPVFFLDAHDGSIVVLLTGLILTLAATAYLFMQSSRERRIENLVSVRTNQVRLATELMKEDVVARKRAEQALQLRERAIESSANAILITSATLDGYPIEYVNPAFEQITGYTEQQIIGKPLDFLHGDDNDQPGLQEIRSAIRERRSGHAIFRNYRVNGTAFWNDFRVAPVRDEFNDITHFVIALYDVTAMKRYEAELEHQARHDTLTGLSNRNVLRDRLGQSILYGALYGHQAWVLYIDLDRFKFINDTLGHNAGDTLLIKVAERLRSFSQDAETIARISSDEFVMIVPERADVPLGVDLLTRIMNELGLPFEIEGHEFFVTCSIGVAVFPADGENAETLLKSADIAMYRAKEMGSNTYQFYTAAMNESAMERLRIEGDLRNALERDELILHYQPQVDLRTGQVVGMEALVRWIHPHLGLISPARFINVAEQNGLIVSIGAWALRTACQQNKEWQRNGLGYLRVSVNLSARQFYQQGLVESIADVLNETGLAPHYLELELTESLVMGDVEMAVDLLGHLKAIGVQLSIDDFGTGYSSLSYLKSFPIDTLKIDQSFVRDICVDRDDAAIVASIIALAHNLRLQVIAEGVETQEQLVYLQRHRCDEMQGFYFSAPVSAIEMETILKEKRSLR